MGRRYAIFGQLNGAAMTSSNKSLLDVISTTTIRPRVYDFSVSTIGTPANNSITWQAQRLTASGTRTGVTPAAVDNGDPANTALAGSAHSTEPTYTANTVEWTLGVNQQASYRWVAAPMSEIVCPATANNGLGWAAKSAAYTGDALVTAMYEE